VYGVCRLLFGVPATALYAALPMSVVDWDDTTQFRRVCLFCAAMCFPLLYSALQHWRLAALFGGQHDLWLASLEGGFQQKAWGPFYIVCVLAFPVLSFLANVRSASLLLARYRRKNSRDELTQKLWFAQKIDLTAMFLINTTSLFQLFMCYTRVVRDTVPNMLNMEEKWIDRVRYGVRCDQSDSNLS
jgi:hypothetical protein